MFMLRVVAAGALAACGALAADDIVGDMHRGEQLFQTERCAQCHSINGRGGTTAPDLGRRIDRDFTPAVMASLMWNHAPRMWETMRSQGIERPMLSPEQSADLFAFFVSARYFEKPGDAGRGKQTFSRQHCAECHGITGSNAAGAPPVAQWESLSDPVALAQQMWNHGPKMSEELVKRKIRRPDLTGQELTDMLVYLQNLPETRRLAGEYLFTPSAPGAALFQSKGCAQCHQGRLALEDRLKNQSLTEIAVDMWNHQPKMQKSAPTLSQEEMRQLLGYVWARQYFRGSGSPDRGKRVFMEKNCAACHNDPSSGAPNLARGNLPYSKSYSDITMVSVLWEHGPRMLEMMTQRKIEWPRFMAQQMTDLISYLNSL